MCPDENTLVAFASGALSMADAARVEEHLDGCGVCFSLVAELARSDVDEADPTQMLVLGDDGPAVSGKRRRVADMEPGDHQDDDESEQTLLAPLSIGVSATHTPPNQPPTQLGRYTVLHRLGAGAMGVVYAAVDRELGRRVALKLIEATGLDAAERGARLLREAQALARLAHPNVVTVFDAGRVDGQVFVSMELVGGVTLAEWLRDTKPGWQGILAVFCQAAAGLAAAHASGIIHRDFKPSNVLVDEQGRARVVDFGLARAFGPVRDDAQTVIRPNPTEIVDASGGSLRRSTSELSESGVVAGTPAYMAPEQYDGLGDARIDQFAFCVAFFDALFGRRPFEGRDADALQARMATGVPPNIPLHSDVPDWLARIVLRGLLRDPDRRFPSMQALLEAIDLAQRRRVLWRRVAIGAGAASVVGVVAAAALAHDAPHPCDDSRDRLAGIWDDVALATMSARIEAVRAPYAAEGWASARAITDRWVTGWVEAATAQCRAEAGAEPGDTAAGRGLCLDRRRSQLRALAEQWKLADAVVVENLVGAAQSLASVTSCDDAPIPSEGGVFDLVGRVGARRVREQLIDAEAAGATGAFARGIPVAARALEGATALGTGHALLGEANLVLGELMLGAGQTESGAVHVDVALQSSIARDDPRMLVRAAAAAARSATLGGRAPEQILQLVAIGRAALGRVARRVHGDDDALAAELDLCEARAHRLGSRHELALDAASRALVLREGVWGEQDLRVAAALVELGSAATAARRPDDGLGHQRRALSIREGLLGGAHPLVATSCAAVADALVALGRIDEARELGQRALSIRERAYGGDDARVADSLSQLGAIEAELGHIDLALARHRRALEIRERLPDALAQVRALNLLASTLVTLGRWDEAEAVLHRAIELGVTLGGRHGEVATSHFQLGRTAHGRGDFARAVAEFSTALESRRGLLGANDPSVALTSAWLARAERDRGGLDAAFAAAVAALASLDARVDPDSWAHARLVLADVAWARGDTAGALAGVTEALAFLRGLPVAPAPVAMLEAWATARTEGGTIAIEP